VTLRYDWLLLCKITPPNKRVNLSLKVGKPVSHSRLFEIAHVLVRFDHVARFIANANHSIM
jgi:hypothetical protein